MADEAPRKIKANFWRRLVQILFLALFLFLFRKTDYGGTDEIPYAVNVFFRFDPLAAAASILAGKTIIGLMLPALALVLATVVLGRFFCGWVCPMGTLLDGARKVIPARKTGPAGRYRTLKYYLLAIVLTSALFGLQLVGYLDPFSILTRGLALTADPALHHSVTSIFEALYKGGPGWLTDISEPVYKALVNTLLPYKGGVFHLGVTAGLILIVVFALERIERRFWCRNLCPLGAMLGLVARFGLLKWYPGKACDKKCMKCAEVCRMGAIDDEGRISPEACNLCLDCVDECDKKIIGFKFKRVKPKPAPLGISRRGFVGSLAAGAVLPALPAVSAASSGTSHLLIRPPGSLPEKEFLARCLRCGECMKVCIKNALQPSVFQAGLEGVFTPAVVPRIGYCEYNCTLCGQVCPTGAITRLAGPEKKLVVIGRAAFDPSICVPYARGIPCFVCEEMCPLPDKAIQLKSETIKGPDGTEMEIERPYVLDHLCIGCGTCEHVCPVEGPAGVRVSREGESRSEEF